MGFEHRVIEQDGHRLHEIADSEGGYRIQVDNLGAELVSVARPALTAAWPGIFTGMERSSPLKGLARSCNCHGLLFCTESKGKGRSTKGTKSAAEIMVSSGTKSSLTRKSYSPDEVRSAIHSQTEKILAARVPAQSLFSNRLHSAP